MPMASRLPCSPSRRRRQRLVVAALLHDIGHLLHELPEDIADQGVDTQHESHRLGLAVAAFPARGQRAVRLHVAAKRYLCATEPGYLGELSAASIQSLELQGGPMSPPKSPASPPSPSPKPPCACGAGTTSPSARISRPRISRITAR
jgi:Predicted HD phosphohydrolase